MNDRYSRHILLAEIGELGQQKLLEAKVLVVGAGGLGCPVLQYLTAAGVGTLGIIDFDKVEESNLQRQILYGMSDLGKNKALSAKKRLLDLNPNLQINAFPEKLTTENALSLFSQYDLIVDGSDNFATRYLVNDACLLTGKPLVYGAIYKFEGQVAVFNYRGGPSYRCLFPIPPSPNEAPSCSEIGVLGVLPGIIGCYQANEVLKLILGIGESLSGKLLLFNALRNSYQTLQIQPNTEVVEQVKKNGLQASYEEICSTDIAQDTAIVINIEQIPYFQELTWVDIRMPHEQPKATLLPMNECEISKVEAMIRNTVIENPLLLCCQSGVRSLKLAKELQAKGYQVRSLTGGINALVKSEYYLSLPTKPLKNQNHDGEKTKESI